MIEDTRMEKMARLCKGAMNEELNYLLLLTIQELKHELKEQRKQNENRYAVLADVVAQLLSDPLIAELRKDLVDVMSKEGTWLDDVRVEYTQKRQLRARIKCCQEILEDTKSVTGMEYKAILNSESERTHLIKNGVLSALIKILRLERTRPEVKEIFERYLPSMGLSPVDATYFRQIIDQKDEGGEEDE